MRINWEKSLIENEKVLEFSKKLELTNVVANFLLNRGIDTIEEAENFLKGEDFWKIDPFLLSDMQKAVLRIEEAILKKEKIVVYGDYDVDGVTATSLVCLVLKEFGANVSYYIPERQIEGYGLNIHALEHLLNKGAELIFTVDCGIGANEEISAIADRVNVIVTDHHEPPLDLPRAYAIINPKKIDCEYPFKQLAGVGVALRFCQALYITMNKNVEELIKYLDIVAIGTIADMVPLIKENRNIVKAGLRQLAITENKGLRALMDLLNIEGEIESSKISFAIAPRINAVGRMSKALAGVQLLLTQDEEEAKLIAQKLEEENIKRQQMEREIFAKAVEEIALNCLFNDNVIIVAGEDWHQGVIGIVASKLLNKYHRPIVMISLKDGIGKGSCRSVANFDIYNALSRCKDILLSFGGHQQAAGLKLKEEDISALRIRLNSFANEILAKEDYLPSIKIDAFVESYEINNRLLEEIKMLAPFGIGNPKPVIACKDFFLKDFRCIGLEKNHLKLMVTDENIEFDVLAWEMAEYSRFLINDREIVVAFTPEYNNWQGKQCIQLRAYDFFSNDAVKTIDRQFLLNTYSVIKKRVQGETKYNWVPEEILLGLEKIYSKKFPVGILNLAVEILVELELIDFKSENDYYKCVLIPTKEKKELINSNLYKKIEKFKMKNIVK